jgi:hypothetical protein
MASVLGTKYDVPMPDERLEVSVTFDERRGYSPARPSCGRRCKIEALLLPDNVRVVLQLDGLAERERHRRRALVR